MHYRIILITILCALTLGACAPPPLASWYRPNLTEAQWQADNYACERDERMAAGSFGRGAVGEFRAQQFWERCMQARGYEKVAQ